MARTFRQIADADARRRSLALQYVRVRAALYGTRGTPEGNAHFRNRLAELRIQRRRLTGA